MIQNIDIDESLIKKHNTNNTQRSSTENEVFLINQTLNYYN